MVPGAEPGARQSLFWLASSELPETGPMAKIMADASYRTDPAHIRYFKAFASIGKDAALFPGSMVMMKPDVENLARVGRVDLPLGSYAWLRGMQGIGRRDFRSLAYPFSEGYAIPVALLVGRITGKGRSAAGARDFLLWLLSLENQKRLSEMTGYMAANFNAANLDQNALAAREAATAAERIVPIDPEPAQRSVSAAWDSLLGRILAKPSEWERVLAEKENG